MSFERKRKQIRLKNYDYSQSGIYFITICTYNRENIFGIIENGIMLLNEYGKIAYQEILVTNDLRKKDDICISKFVIMPNHIHMVVKIVGTRRAVSEQYEEFSKPTKNSISTVIRAYKSAVTKKIHQSDNGHGTPCPYEIWQSRFYDHIIRNKREYEIILKYIDENPFKWKEDCLYNQ